MAKLKTDWILFLTILAMTGFGIVMVYSASSAAAKPFYNVEPYYFVAHQIGLRAGLLLRADVFQAAGLPRA